MKPHNVTEDQIKLRAFPFAVQDAAKDWLYDLPPGMVTTWVDLSRLFLDKYFPEMKASSLRREIIGIKQHKREAFHTYWERFKKLCARCPKHGITEYQILQNFIEGMTPMERRLLNASSGGSLPDKTPTKIRNLIKNMAEDSKHSSHDEEWYTDAPRGVKEVQTLQIEAQFSELTKVVVMLAKDKGQIREVMSNHEVIKDGTIIRSRHPQQPPPQAGSSSMSLEDIVKSLATSTQSFQQETKASIKILEQQVLQLAISVSKLESQGKLPAQTETNPRHNVCAITLRGENSYNSPKVPVDQEEEEIVIEKATK
ncbi:hypothetical protein Lser_V15G40151 [Lactuca serriola]